MIYLCLYMYYVCLSAYAVRLEEGVHSHMFKY